MNARLNILEGMRQYAASLTRSTNPEEAEEAAAIEKELSERINTLRFSLSKKEHSGEAKASVVTSSQH